MNKLSNIACFSFIFVVACTESESANDRQFVNKDIESRVTIKQGIYGLTYSVNDVGNADEKLNPGFKILLSNNQKIDTVTSDVNGIFQITLSPGDYTLCTSFQRCTEIKLGTEAKRCDYEMSVGPGWSCGSIINN